MKLKISGWPKLHAEHEYVIATHAFLLSSCSLSDFLCFYEKSLNMNHF